MHKSRLNLQNVLTRLDRDLFATLKLIRRMLISTDRTRQVIFVAGVHRSGTNMLLNILNSSYETDVYGENDRRAFTRFMMREGPVIQTLIENSRAPVFVIKALHEAHRLSDLLQQFAPASAIWMVRSFEDMVNSNIRRFPGPSGSGMIREIVNDRNSAAWRGLGMTDETHRIVCEHYHPNINDASAAALFWFYRNQLFFDQNFDQNERVLAVQYEDLVSDPESIVPQIATFVGIGCTRRMREIPHSESIRKNSAPEISSEIKVLCQGMQKRLRAVINKVHKASAKM